MNKNIFKNRTVVGLCCIVLSLIVCFGITPLFNSSMKAQSDIVRVKTDIPQGALVTDSMLETAEVGAHNLPLNVLKDKANIVGKYAVADLQAGDYILSGKLSAEPLSASPYLTRLDGEKAAVSVTIPTFASGLSGKLEAGDIITIISANIDTKITNVPPELRYVEVLATTASTGKDRVYGQPDKDSEDNPEESLPATITLLVNMEQAKVLADLEVNSKIHAALVYRGARENCDAFLVVQEEYFLDKEVATPPAETTTPPAEITEPTAPTEDTESKEDVTDGN